MKVYTDEQRIQLITQSANIHYETWKSKTAEKQTIEDVVNEIKNAKVNYIKEKAQISANIAKMEEFLAMKAEIKVNDSIRKSSRSNNYKLIEYIPIFYFFIFIFKYKAANI